MSREDHPGSALVITGPPINIAMELSLVGRTAISFLDDVYMDKVFVSVCGIDVALGITVIESDEALAFRAMIRHAKKMIMVADSSKIGVVTPTPVCPISDVRMLITDTRASDKAGTLRRARFGESEIRVLGLALFPSRVLEEVARYQ